jgi:DNA-binding transcriptional regulator/RsmH inhibitor MraZ
MESEVLPMKLDRIGSGEVICLYAEDGRRIETQVMWDRKIKPGEKFAVTKGFGESLFLMTDDELKLFEEMLQSVSCNPMFSSDLNKYFKQGVFNVETDESRALYLPTDLMEFSGIKTDAVIKGVGDFAQIWSGKDSAEKEFVGGIEGIRPRLMIQAALADIGGV